MTRALAAILVVLLLGISGATWAAPRGHAAAPGPSSGSSKMRHGFPSGLGP